MAGKEPENRLFVGGLSWDVSERDLEETFSRYGKIIDSQIVLDRETGRPRGFGFLTFGDRHDMEVAIREMDGREFGDRPITVNKAQPRFGGGEDPGHGYGGGGGGYPSGGGRGGSYGGGGGDRSVSENDCFKCGRAGHWARDCPSTGGGGGGRGRGEFSSHSRFGGGRGRGDHHFGGDRDRYVDDRYDGGRYGDRDRYESRDRYGARDRYASDSRYPPSGDRFSSGDRYGGGADRYPLNGFGKDRGYDRDGVGAPPRGPVGGVADRYGGGGGPSRYEGKTYRDRPAPYERPRRGGGRPSSFDDRY